MLGALPECIVHNVSIHGAYNISNIVADPPINFAIDHLSKADVHTGIYNFTVYISLLRHDPLLLATINGFRILLSFEDRLLPTETEEVVSVENKVINACTDDLIMYFI